MADDAGPNRAEEGAIERSPDPGEPLDVESLWQLIEGCPARELGDPLVGLTVAGVTLTRLIAEGGMGRVYEGRQAAPSRLVAVKLLRPGVLARGSIERFIQEAEILGRLRHPCITQIYSAGTVEVAGAGLPYFVMELIPEARPITEYPRRHDLRLADRIGLFQQVCEAVGHAHERDVIHRDLKPSNILVSWDGQPGVIDFGVARSGGPAGMEGGVTATGQLLGTLQYMSPEQLDGRPVDARSDVYALGMILHELVLGRPPYETAGRPLVDAALLIREARPAAGDLLACPAPGIGLIIDRCLQKDPKRRYGDAGELAADVRRCLARESSVATNMAARARLVSRRFPRGSRRSLSLSMLVLGAVVGVPLLLRSAGAGRSPTGPPALETPSLASAVLPFRSAISNVFDPEADRFLVEAVDVRKWDDPREEPRLTYWGPCLKTRLIVAYDISRGTHHHAAHREASRGSLSRDER
jgi:serine/threonine protein kinase